MRTPARPVRRSAVGLLTDALVAAGPALHGVHVEVAVAEGVPPVLADPVLTERILVGVLHDAVRHGRPPVRLGAAARDGRVELTVAAPGRARLVLSLPRAGPARSARRGRGPARWRRSAAAAAPRPG